MTKSVFLLCFSVVLLCLTGCGEESKPKSMTEGVELSEIQAYEEAVRAMENEDAGGMDKVKE